MAERAVGAQATATTWLVEDEAEVVPPGRLRKREFLARLRPALCRAADAELQRVGQDTRGCPYLERAFAHYARLSAPRLEQAMRRFAPQAAAARSVDEVIAQVAARVAEGVARWTRTGELPELPDGVDLAALASGGLLGGLAALAGPFSGVLGGVARLFFKAAPGAPAPQAARAGAGALASGSPLATSVRQSMSSALGQALPDVRVHTGAEAASLNARLGSRAFTLGHHIAFGPGEYQPGTPVGDALLAHELAHVLQQGRDVSPLTLPQAAAPSASDAVLEADADEAATGAVVSLWGRGRSGLRALGARGGPRLKSALRLQMSNCGEFARLPVRAERVASLQGRAAAACNQEQRQDMTQINSCCTAEMLQAIEANLSQGIPRVRNALAALQNPGDAARPLRENFGVAGDDATRVGVIRGRFQQMLDLMTGSDVTFLCRSRQSEPFCQPDASGRQTIASASNCARGGPLMMQFCGDYDEAVRGGNYFPSLGGGNNWVKNLVHEYAHLAGSRECAMLPAGSESYRGDQGGRPYPPARPDDAVRNADSYAWFAMDVSAEYRVPAAAARGAGERSQVLYANALRVLGSGPNVNPTLNAILSRGRVGQRVPRVHVASAFATGRPGPTFNFDLELSTDATQLAPGALAQFDNDAATQTSFDESNPANPVITRLLKIVFREPPGAAPAHLLAEVLRHEGTHMLLEIDRSFGAFRSEPAIANAMTGAQSAFERYRSAAAASAHHATLVSELVAELGATTSGTPAEHDAKARQVVDQVLEERFAVDEQARQFPRTVSNAQLARAYLFDYLAATVLGPRRTWPVRPTRQRLLELMQALLDDTSAALSQAGPQAPGTATPAPAAPLQTPGTPAPVGGQP